jgi:hypothetical protein
LIRALSTTKTTTTKEKKPNKLGPVQTKPNIKTPNKTKLQSQAKLKSSSSSILNCNAMEYGTWNAKKISSSSSSSPSSSTYLPVLIWMMPA